MLLPLTDEELEAKVMKLPPWGHRETRWKFDPDTTMESPMFFFTLLYHLTPLGPPTERQACFLQRHIFCKINLHNHVESTQKNTEREITQRQQYCDHPGGRSMTSVSINF